MELRARSLPHAPAGPAVMDSFAQLALRGVAGGLMVGLGGAIVLLALGGIGGVSGLTARAAGITQQGQPRASALAFVLGLPAGALLAAVLFGLPTVRYPSSSLLLVAAGLAIGFGARLGNGCTSGHGICGVSRFSPRSIAAAATFTAVGVATVAIVNWLGGAW